MIPVAEKTQLETFGTESLEENTFRVKQSPEMFKLLSSAIYSDKVSAVIRELSANAIDAHVMANNEDTPIEVHLPNSFEPFFYVKDFGIGLSKEDILNLYTTYGESTKTKDNLTTGAFGIGSKSPFAYTDQFTITSRFNGTKYVYSCFISTNGMPTVSPISESSTDEPNGLEINFAVSENDFRQFETKAKEIYQYYLVTPNVVGVASFHIDTPKVLMEVTTKSGIKCYILEDTYYEKAKAVQGSCVYPIDTNKILDKTSVVDKVFARNCLIKFPIGSLNITASREALEYNNPTCNNLKAAAVEIVDALTKEVTRMFKEDIKSKWDAARKSKSLCSTLPVYDLIKDTVMWRKQTLNQWRTTSFDMGFNDTTTETITDPTDPTQVLTRDVKKPYSDIREYGSGCFRHYQTLKPINITSKVQVSPHEKHIVIVVDTEGTKRFNPTLEENFKRNVPEELKDFSSVYYVKPYEGSYKRVWKEVNHMFKNCEGVTIIKFKDLAEPTFVSTQGTSRNTNKVLVLRKHSCYTNKGCWTAEQKDLNNGGIYVNMSNYVPKGFYDGQGFHKFIRKLRAIKMIPENVKIYGIPASYKTVPDNYPKWKHLDDFLKERFDKFLKGVDIKEVRSLDYQKKELNRYSKELNLIKHYKDSSKDILSIHTYVENLKATPIDSLLDIIKAYEDWKIQRGEEVTITDIKAEETEFSKLLTSLKEKYMLLFEYGEDPTNYRCDDKHVGMMKDYINLVDSQKETPQ